jgi:hypothetical protein
MGKTFVWLAACAAFGTGCASTSGQTTLSATVASPPSPTGDHVVISFDSDRDVELEELDPASDTWGYVCTVPCTQVMRTVGVYRLYDGSGTSQPFPIVVDAEPWVVVSVARDGRAWVSDSPTLRAVREQKELEHHEATENALNVFALVADVFVHVVGALHR